MTKKTYSTEELANLVGVHPETIRREIRRGNLRAAVIGGRISRISEVEAAAWWEAAGGGRLWEDAPPATDGATEPSK